MLLAIDIGNTNISCGIFKGSKLIKKFDIPTRTSFKKHLAKRIKDPFKISASIICSVVPKQTKIVFQDIVSLTGKTPYILGKNLIVPIKNLYHKPKQVGQDRLVNAFAASFFYRPPLIVIDSGTAITFDVISRNKAYLGGLIVPGMGISLAALKEKTALLPQVKLDQPQSLIGTDTKKSMISGVVLGTADLCKGLTARLKQELGKNVQVVGTGGNICMIKKYSRMHMKVNSDLTLKGINLIYRDEIK